MNRIPVILDTDIGSDIDDTWALAMMLNSPELDPRLIVTTTHNTPHRACIVAKLLEIAGRTDISIGIGIYENDDLCPQASWVQGYSLSNYPGTLYKDGVDATIRTIMEASEPLTIVAIGPLSNIAEALRREPQIAEHSRFVGMQGSIRVGYEGKETPDPEYNVAANVRACREVFTAGWEMTITPLDTCGLVRLESERYQAVVESRDPVAQAVIENYRIWSGGVLPARSSVLFDTVAVHLAFSTDLLHMEALGIRITDEGFTVIDRGAKVVNCATRWKDLAAFEDEVAKRVSGKGRA